MTKYRLICEVWLTEKASWQGIRDHVLTFDRLEDAETKMSEYEQYLSEQIRNGNTVSVGVAEEEEFNGLCVLWTVHGIEKETTTFVR